MTTARSLSMATIWPIVSLVGVVLAAAALALSAFAVSRDASGATTPAVAVGGECAWVTELGSDWLPAIGAEPAC